MQWAQFLVRKEGHFDDDMPCQTNDSFRVFVGPFNMRLFLPHGTQVETIR